MNSTAPATSTIFTSEGHFSTNTFRTSASFLANGPRAGSPLDLLKTNEVRAAAPSQSPLHAHEFYGMDVLRKRQSKHRVDRRGMLLITDAERPRPLG